MVEKLESFGFTSLGRYTQTQIRLNISSALFLQTTGNFMIIELLPPSLNILRLGQTS
jgi:hypothetical protein